MPLPIIQQRKNSSDLPPARIIAIAAGKGGVGKSTVAVNLALSLKKLGFRTGIVDADVYGPSIRRMLPEERPPSQEGSKILPAVCKGIEVISMAYFKKEADASVVRAPIANRIIQQFLNDVQWGPLDFLLIDFPPGTGDIQLTLAQQAKLSGAIMVTTPQEVALMDVRKAIHMFELVQVPIIGVVENMSFYKDTSGNKVYLFGKGGGERLASQYKFPFLGAVAVDPEISRSGDEGASLFDLPEAALQGSTAAAFIQIAGNSINELANIAKQPYRLKKIQLDEQGSLLIEWSDGSVGKYGLAELQSKCPCAKCAENRSNGLREQQSSKGPDAVKVFPVGRYGIRIQFSAGCSSGIYQLEELYSLGQENGRSCSWPS